MEKKVLMLKMPQRSLRSYSSYKIGSHNPLASGRKVGERPLHAAAFLSLL